MGWIAWVLCSWWFIWFSEILRVKTHFVSPFFAVEEVVGVAAAHAALGAGVQELFGVPVSAIPLATRWHAGADLVLEKGFRFMEVKSIPEFFFFLV
jgi:hypothetical protein